MGIDITSLSPAAQQQILRKLQMEQTHKQQKYNNVKTPRGDITFDSKKEAARYDELLFLLKQGRISDLRLQPQFTLQESYVTPSGERIRAVRYVADFSYITGAGEKVVEDVKSRATATPQYKLKKKMMQDKLGISVQEV